MPEESHRSEIYNYSVTRALMVQMLCTKDMSLIGNSWVGSVTKDQSVMEQVEEFMFIQVR